MKGGTLMKNVNGTFSGVKGTSGEADANLLNFMGFKLIGNIKKFNLKSFFINHRRSYHNILENQTIGNTSSPLNLYTYLWHLYINNENDKLKQIRDLVNICYNVRIQRSRLYLDVTLDKGHKEIGGMTKYLLDKISLLLWVDFENNFNEWINYNNNWKNTQPGYKSEFYNLTSSNNIMVKRGLNEFIQILRARGIKETIIENIEDVIQKSKNSRDVGQHNIYDIVIPFMQDQGISDDIIKDVINDMQVLRGQLKKSKTLQRKTNTKKKSTPKLKSKSKSIKLKSKSTSKPRNTRKKQLNLKSKTKTKYS